MKTISISGPAKSGKTKLLIEMANTLHTSGRKVRFVGEQIHEVVRKLGLRKAIPYRNVIRDEREHLEIRD